MRNFKFDGNAMRPNVYVASASQTTQPTLFRHQLMLAIFSSDFIYFSGATNSQSRHLVGTAEAVKPLQIGDTIPEELWNMPLQVVNHPEGKDTITLNDYRDKKLIILDFWATWCAPCIKSLYSLDSLQHIFPADLAVVLSSSEKLEKIKSFYTRHDISLFSSFAQEKLKNYFPHNIIPHQIWISEGLILAIPKVEQLSFNKVQEFFKCGKLEADTKIDVLNYSIAENLGSLASRTNTNILYSSTLTPFIDGISSSSDIQDIEGFVRANFVNVSIPLIFQRLLRIPNNRIIVSSTDISKYMYQHGQEQNIYCFQVTLPTEYEDRLEEIALAEACRAFRLRLDSLFIEKDVYVIRSNDALNEQQNLLMDVEFQKGNEQAFESFIDILNFSVLWSPDQPIFINESSYTGKVYTGIDFKGDVEMIKRFLHSYNLELKLERRVVKMYVLQDESVLLLDV